MKVVRTHEVPWSNAVTRGKYASRRKALGGEKLSAGLWELAAGKCSFPLHRHYGTEEALYVLSGQARVRTEDSETVVGPGDFVSYPAGGVAHQLINDGTEAFTYLAISSGVGVDVVEYPESGKVGCMTAGWPNGKSFIFPVKGQVGYFDGEE
jgi:uncharacterized cupin superfamily protein